MLDFEDWDYDLSPPALQILDPIFHDLQNLGGEIARPAPAAHPGGNVSDQDPPSTGPFEDLDAPL